MTHSCHQQNLTLSSFRSVWKSLWKSYVPSIMDKKKTIKKVNKSEWSVNLWLRIWPTFSQSLKCALWTFHPSACYSEPLKLALIAAWKRRKKTEMTSSHGRSLAATHPPSIRRAKNGMSTAEFTGTTAQGGPVWIHSLWPQIPQSLGTSPHSHAPCLVLSSLIQRAAMFAPKLTWDTTGADYPQASAI